MVVRGGSVDRRNGRQRLQGITMSFTDRMIAWNRHYDDIPQKWRLPIVMWTIVAIGAINMMLTIGGHFPFGLLVVLAILVMAAIRVP